ncbi:hypothetical protein AB0Q95_12350 [Streptomyces sp. NPDC059900]
MTTQNAITWPEKYLPGTGTGTGTGTGHKTWQDGLVRAASEETGR